jgi:transposase-like protein
MMGVMTTQPLPLATAGAVLIGDAAALVEDGDGGRVFLRGELTFVWDAGDDLGRRLAAVQLVRTNAAHAVQVAAAFGVATVTLWRWRKELDTSGVQGLAAGKRGPKGPSRLTPEVAADIRTRRRDGASLRAIARRGDPCADSTRRELTESTHRFRHCVPLQTPSVGDR